MREAHPCRLMSLDIKSYTHGAFLDMKKKNMQCFHKHYKRYLSPLLAYHKQMSKSRCVNDLCLLTVRTLFLTQSAWPVMSLIMEVLMLLILQMSAGRRIYEEEGPHRCWSGHRRLQLWPIRAAPLISFKFESGTIILTGWTRICAVKWALGDCLPEIVCARTYSPTPYSCASQWGDLKKI